MTDATRGPSTRDARPIFDERERKMMLHLLDEFERQMGMPLGQVGSVRRELDAMRADQARILKKLDELNDTVRHNQGGREAMRWLLIRLLQLVGIIGPLAALVTWLSGGKITFD